MTKTMKRVFFLLLATICLLAGCNQNDLVVEDKGECVVSFDFVGEITTSDSPMTKTSTDDIYLVQIYKGTAAFAAGIFDDPEKIRFNLKNGGIYRIIVVMLKNGKVILSSVKPDSYALYRTDVNAVRMYTSNNSVLSFYYKNLYSDYFFPINTTYYNSIETFKYYKYDSTNTTSDNKPDYEFSNIDKGSIRTHYPGVDDWFYGEINDYSPTGEYETLSLDLKRVGFKLKYELTGVTDGEVTVKVYNGTKTFINNTTNTSTYSSEPKFYAFYQARNAWLYSDEYMENMTLAVSWYRGIGVTEDYGTKTIQIKRNCLNNIKIQMTSADQTAGMNLTVEAESTIGAEAVTIPVQ